jgi:hypothetical protein
VSGKRHSALVDTPRPVTPASAAHRRAPVKPPAVPRAVRRRGRSHRGRAGDTSAMAHVHHRRPVAANRHGHHRRRAGAGADDAATIPGDVLSSRNCAAMWYVRAPSARRNPISPTRGLADEYNRALTTVQHRSRIGQLFARTYVLRRDHFGNQDDQDRTGRWERQVHSSEGS